MIYSKQAQGFLDERTTKERGRIIDAINKLPEGHVVKIKGTHGGYRLRIGKIRVIFEKYDCHIEVIKIDNRGDVYK